MQNIHDLVDDLIIRANATGLSIQGLAIASGLGINTLRNMRSKGWKPTISTIAELQRALTLIEKMSEAELQTYAAQKKIHPPKKDRYQPKKTKQKKQPSVVIEKND